MVGRPGWRPGGGYVGAMEAAVVRRWGPWVALGLFGVLGVVLVAVAAGRGGGTAKRWVAGNPLVVVPVRLVVDPAPVRTLDPYRGLGTWADAFDVDPVYAPGGPSVSPHDVADMADHGVRTLFLQASRWDRRASGLVQDPWLQAGFLLAAEKAGVAVVGWYLPRWDDGGDDLARLLAVDRFAVAGRRFDGLAVDIEWNRDELGAIERSDRLVELSDRLRRTVGDDPLGAVVMPPVVTDVINPGFWPGFPWAELAPLYDVWLPMAYWSFRTGDHADPRAYTAENVVRVRFDLGDPGALVHAVGGIGAADGTAVVDPGEPLADVDDLGPFVDALVETGAVGGSVYDWATMGAEARVRLHDLMGAASFTVAG